MPFFISNMSKTKDLINTRHNYISLTLCFTILISLGISIKSLLNISFVLYYLLSGMYSIYNYRSCFI